VNPRLRSPVLVGREHELSVLRHAVGRAHRGTGGVLLVAGEAGVGKSRLLAEAGGYAQKLGMPVLVGRAVEGGGPYRAVAEALYARLREGPDAEELRPFRPALARLLPGALPAEPVGGVDPLVVLGEGVLRLLRGAVLVLEDLHWADRDTLALLEYLAPSAAGAGVLVFASARSDEEQPDLLRRLDVARLSLHRLPPDGVAAVATACAGGVPLPAEVVDFLVHTAEGLPFLVEELLAGLVETGSVTDGPLTSAGRGPLRQAARPWTVRGMLNPTVPRTLTELVRERLARIAPQPRRVVEAAAVVGRSVGWDLLGPVTGLDGDAVLAGLRAAVSTYLMEPDGDRFVWRHALMRDAVLAQLLAPERTRVARRAAEVLHAGDPELTGPDAVLVADLYARGGRAELAATALVALARRAVAGGAPQTAAELLNRAEALGAGTAAAVERVRMLTFTGRAVEALEAGVPALVGAAGEGRFALLLGLARAAVTAGRWTEAEGYLRRTGRAGDPRVNAIAADAAHGDGRIDEATVLAESAAAAAQRAGLAEVACEALEVVARCVRLTDPARAAEVFRRAADLAEEHGLVPWRVRALLGVGTVELHREQTATVEQVRELALEAGMLAEVAATDLLLADIAGLVDGPPAALAVAERSAALAGQVGLDQTAAMALAYSAEGYAVLGRTGDMRAALDRAARLAAEVDVAGAAIMAHAMTALLDRDLPRTRDLLDEAVDRLRGHVSAAPLRHWGLWALIRTVLDDRHAAARAELRYSPVVFRNVNRGALHYADAVAAGRDGDGVRAARLLATGDEVLARLHWWRRLLRLQVLGAAIGDGWGDPVAELRRDLAGFDATGDRRLAGTCRDLLRRAGAPVPRRGRGDSAVPAALRAVGVTSREMDVLNLVAQGLTNAQIAERLFLSTRTVETHMANLLAKTGAAGRAELGKLAD
jgi:DNA-binding CsgD family transcriptional regulator